MTRRYVSVKFRPGDQVGYTYHHDGEPLAAGDKVLVPGRGGNGTRIVTVCDPDVPPPKFETKAIIGKELIGETPPDEPKAGGTLL